MITAEYLCDLPEGFDARTRMVSWGRMIVVVHPDHAPRQLTPANTWEPLNADL